MIYSYVAFLFTRAPIVAALRFMSFRCDVTNASESCFRSLICAVRRVTLSVQHERGQRGYGRGAHWRLAWPAGQKFGSLQSACWFAATCRPVLIHIQQRYAVRWFDAGLNHFFVEMSFFSREASFFLFAHAEKFAMLTCIGILSFRFFRPAFMRL